MVLNSMNSLNQPKTICIPIELVCIIYGFFTCVLGLFGILMLVLGRLYIYLITIFDGITKNILYVGFYDADIGGEVEDISMDFTFKFLNWETLPISGYGILFYMSFIFSIFFSVVLCYGIHVRGLVYLDAYLVYGVTVTACMLLAFFYLYAWFTDCRLYSVIAVATTLYVHWIIHRTVKRLHRLFNAESYHRLGHYQ